MILTTCRDWAQHIAASELGTVEIIEKPYELDRMVAAVRVALERASNWVAGQVLAQSRLTGNERSSRTSGFTDDRTTTNHRPWAQHLPFDRALADARKDGDPPVH